MKTGVVPKILSVVLSLIFLGSGLLHPFIHSCGRCPCETEKVSSASGCCDENAIPGFHGLSAYDFIQPIKVICQICAGMFNFVSPPYSVKALQDFSESVFQIASASPVSVTDYRLPQTRAPPLS